MDSLGKDMSAKKVTFEGGKVTASERSLSNARRFPNRNSATLSMKRPYK